METTLFIVPDEELSHETTLLAPKHALIGRLPPTLGCYWLATTYVKLFHAKRAQITFLIR